MRYAVTANADMISVASHVPLIIRPPRPSSLRAFLSISALSGMCSMLSGDARASNCPTGRNDGGKCASIAGEGAIRNNR